MVELGQTPEANPKEDSRRVARGERFGKSGFGDATFKELHGDLAVYRRRGDDSPPPGDPDTRAIFETRECRGVCAIFTVHRDGKLLVLLVREIEGPYAGQFSPLSGKIELGETPFVAVKREATEEASRRLTEALEARTEHAPDALFYKTATWVTQLPSDCLDVEFDPSQIPAETDAMRFFPVEELHEPASTQLAGIEKLSATDHAGFSSPISKYARGLVRHLVKLSKLSLKPNEAPIQLTNHKSSREPSPNPTRKRSSIRAPSIGQCTTGLALLTSAAADATGDAQPQAQSIWSKGLTTSFGSEAAVAVAHAYDQASEPRDLYAMSPAISALLGIAVMTIISIAVIYNITRLAPRVKAQTSMYHNALKLALLLCSLAQAEASGRKGKYRAPASTLFDLATEPEHAYLFMMACACGLHAMLLDYAVRAMVKTFHKYMLEHQSSGETTPGTHECPHCEGTYTCECYTCGAWKCDNDRTHFGDCTCAADRRHTRASAAEKRSRSPTSDLLCGQNRTPFTTEATPHEQTQCQLHQCSHCGSWGYKSDYDHTDVAPAKYPGARSECPKCGAWARLPDAITKQQSPPASDKASTEEAPSPAQSLQASDSASSSESGAFDTCGWVNLCACALCKRVVKAGHEWCDRCDNILGKGTSCSRCDKCECSCTCPTPLPPPPASTKSANVAASSTEELPSPPPSPPAETSSQTCACAHCIKTADIDNAYCIDCVNGEGMDCTCVQCGQSNCCCICTPSSPRQQSNPTNSAPATPETDATDSKDSSQNEPQRQCICTTCTKKALYDSDYCVDCNDEGLNCLCVQCGRCKCCCRCPPNYFDYWGHCQCYHCIQVVYEEFGWCDFCLEHQTEFCECETCNKCDCCCDCEQPEGARTPSLPPSPPNDVHEYESDESNEPVWQYCECAGCEMMVWEPTATCKNCTPGRDDLCDCATCLGCKCCCACNTPAYNDEIEYASEICNDCDEPHPPAQQKRVARGIGGMRKVLLSLGASSAMGAPTVKITEPTFSANTTWFVMMLVALNLCIVALTVSAIYRKYVRPQANSNDMRLRTMLRGGTFREADSPPDKMCGGSAQKSVSRKLIYSPNAAEKLPAIGGTRPKAQRAPMQEAKSESPPAKLLSNASAVREMRTPQPTSAKNARRASATLLAEQLVADNSQYALCPGDPTYLTALCMETVRVREEGIPQGTLKSDEQGFKAVRHFCESRVDTPWMRPFTCASQADRLREALFYAMAFVAIAATIKPGKHSAEKGMTQGKPSSALNYIYGYRRVQDFCGRWIPDSKMLLQALKGMNRSMHDHFGQDCLIPRKTQPFALSDLHKMVSRLVRRAIKGWTNTLHIVMLALICFCLATGTRCNEWACTDPNDTYIRRANFVVVINGIDMLMTPITLNAIVNGDMIRAHSAPSKCDRDNTTWGSTKQWFRYDDTNPLNFAYRWVQYELAHPCPIGQRATWPAFSPTGDSKPFSTSTARNHLISLMVAALGAAEAALRSWHAFRVTIACALMANPKYKDNPKVIEAIAMAMCRWKTVESVHEYGKMGSVDYADWVDTITTTDAHPTRHLSEEIALCPRELYGEFDAAIIELKSTGKSDRLEAAIIELKSTDKAEPEEIKVKGATKNAKDQPASTPDVFDCGEEGMIECKKGTSILVGNSVTIPNCAWRCFKGAKTAKTVCKIVGYNKSHKIDGIKSTGVYIVETAGQFYAFHKNFWPFKKSKK